ncbi:succinate-semialdehyde dehydrogenase [Fusarium agapanthi]|uniref:Succinate-semialdehyde dehydrogenase n=1 Tax=Fusarium agapanthi TaxID=1803897 RepID=A0A9P5EB44_9HYPO|nr:succinate-semialdehyde dehydrogenase [Fusarium agapanthi]
MAYSLPFKLNRPDLLITNSYIQGQTKPALSGSTFDVLDPGTNKPWVKVTNNSADDVDATVRVAHKAFQFFKKTSPRARAQWLLEWDALIPEAERIQGTCFAPSAPDRRVVTIKQPLGVAVALVPWNFPVAMVLRKAAAALAAGCTMVVKPWPETPVTAMALAKLATEAGFPDGVLNVLPTSLENTPSLSDVLCKHDLVKKVTFTGSTSIGTLVAYHCSSGLKKVVLELGGNCPCLIFDDADIEAALRELVGIKWCHPGEACVTVNRFLVQSGVYDKFLQRFVEETAKYRVWIELDEIALQNRIAVTTALEESDIKAGVSTLRDLAKANQVMLICETHHKLYSSSNWSGLWQGIDFTKAAPKSYDLTSHRKEMVVLGQSKTLKAPTRCFWCEFAAPVKTMALAEKFFRWDPSLGILLEEMEYYGTSESRQAFKSNCRLPLPIVFILILIYEQPFPKTLEWCPSTSQDPSSYVHFQTPAPR